MPKNNKIENIGVILEDINSKFSIIQEGYTSLSEQMGGLQTQVGGLQTQVDGLQTQVDGLQTQMNKNYQEFLEFRKETNSNFKTVFDFLSKFDEELQSIKTEITEIKKSLTKKVDIDRMENLERKVVYLEMELTKIKQKT